MKALIFSPIFYYTISPSISSFLSSHLRFHSSTFPSYFLSFSFSNSFIISAFNSLHQTFLLKFPKHSSNHLHLPIFSLHFLLTLIHYFCFQFSQSSFRLTFKSPGVTYVGKEINTETTTDTKKNREKESTFRFQPTLCASSNICLTIEFRIAMRQNRHHMRGLLYRLMTSGTVEIASMNISICGVMPLNQAPARCILFVRLVAVK